MNCLGLRNDWLKFKVLGELVPIVLEESMEYIPDLIKGESKDRDM